MLKDFLVGNNTGLYVAEGEEGSGGSAGDERDGSDSGSDNNKDDE